MILLGGNMYITLADYVLLAFILHFRTNHRLSCWVLHMPSYGLKKTYSMFEYQFFN